MFRHTSLEDMSLRDWHVDKLIVNENPVAGVGAIEFLAEGLRIVRGAQAREEHLAVNGVHDGGNQLRCRIRSALFDAQAHALQVLQ